MSELWWQTAFDEDYLATYAHRDDAAARDEIHGLLPRLRSVPGPILDACGGTGRHHQALRDAGLSVVGFDWSMDLLRVANARPGIHGQVARADVRSPPFTGGFAAVLLLFTAFGYFDDGTNAQTLAGLADLLAPGGWLVLDLPDAAWLRANLIPESHRQLADGSDLLEQRWFDGATVCKRITRRRASGTTHRLERVRIYDDPELMALATGVGLNSESPWASLRGPDHDDHRRIWWLQRPT